MPPRALPLFGSLMLPLLLAGCAGMLRLPGGTQPAEKARISDAPPAVPFKPAGNVIVEAVEKVGPAVVRIDTVKHQCRLISENPMKLLPNFYRKLI